MDSFFQDLPVFDDFRKFSSPGWFKPVPREWKVFVADVEGSEKCIQAGRYRDVNTLGAACIASVQRALPALAFPFTFGGDGATMVLPAFAEEPATVALQGIRRIAAKRFGIALRVGRIGVDELADDGFLVAVGRLRLAGKATISLFRGGGVSEGERRIKSDPGRYRLLETAAGATDLNELSCRWSPIPSLKGTVLTLIVSARSKYSYAGYRSLVRGLDEILDGDVANANPVHLANMKYLTLSEIASRESRLHASRLSWGFLKRLVEIAAAVLIFRHKVPPLFFDADRYAESMRAHSDYRKFDDVLRLVLDCTPAQKAAILALLDRLKSEGRIFYGVHESASALMTCWVSGLEDGEHIHFIDGGDGGYALASLQYKEQRKSAG